MCKKLFMSFLLILGIVSSNVLAVDPNFLAQYTFDSGDATDNTGHGHDCVPVEVQLTCYVYEFRSRPPTQS